MRARFLILIMLFSFCMVSAQSIRYVNGEIQDGLDITSIVEKPLLVYVYMDWSQEHLQMQERTMSDPEVIRILNNRYIKLNCNGAEGWGLSFKYENEITQYPAILLYSPQGKLIHRKLGFIAKEEFKDLLVSTANFAENATLIKSYEELDEHYNDKSFLRTYLDAAGEEYIPNKSEILDRYFSLLSLNERKTNYDFFYEKLNLISPEILSFIVADYERPGGFFLSAEDRKKHESFINAVFPRIQELIDWVLVDGDMNDYNYISETNIEFTSKVEAFNAIHQQLATKQNDLLKLELLKRDSLIIEYGKLGEYIIDKYVLIKSPSQFREIDESDQNIGKDKLIQLFEQETIRRYVDDKLENKSIQQKKKDNLNAFIASDLLYRISSDYASLFPNEGGVSRASYWAGMTYRYFDLPKYYLLHGNLLIQQEKQEQAIEVFNQGLKSSSLDQETQTKLMATLKGLTEPSEN